MTKQTTTSTKKSVVKLVFGFSDMDPRLFDPLVSSGLRCKFSFVIPKRSFSISCENLRYIKTIELAVDFLITFYLTMYLVLEENLIVDQSRFITI